MNAFIPCSSLTLRTHVHTTVCPPTLRASRDVCAKASTFTSHPITLHRAHTRRPITTTTMLMEKPTNTTDEVIDVVSDDRRKYLCKFIREGPVFQRADLIMTPDDAPQAICTTDALQTCLDDWLEMASILQDALGPQGNDIRIYRYYLPVYFWILRELDRHRDRIAASPNPSHRPFILGFCCPQGGGKTTMTTFIETMLRAMGKNVQIASLDDFYVTNQEQQAIAKEFPNNRMMQYRGMPGTHDLTLLGETLDMLREGHPVSIPCYDKTLFNGRGDRATKDHWKHISESTDVVLLEGWCLGFEPVDKENLLDADLSVVNDALEGFGSIYSRLDGLFLIEISDMEWVYDWRLQAERGSRAAGKSGLSDDQVIDFVDRFMPAYKQYSQQLYRRPTPLIENHELHIEIDQERRPVYRDCHRS